MVVQRGGPRSVVGRRRRGVGARGRRRRRPLLHDDDGRGHGAVDRSLEWLETFGHAAHDGGTRRRVERVRRSGVLRAPPLHPSDLPPHMQGNQASGQQTKSSRMTDTAAIGRGGGEWRQRLIGWLVFKRANKEQCRREGRREAESGVTAALAAALASAQ